MEAEVKTIGFMFSTYEEYGPEDIAVYGPDADLAECYKEYVVKAYPHYNYTPDELEKEIGRINLWLSDPNREKNVTFATEDGWGGIQMTELAIK